MNVNNRERKNHSHSFMATVLIVISIFMLSFGTSYADHHYSEDRHKVTIGVLSFKSKEETAKKWKPLADYLTESISHKRYIIKPLFYREFDEAIGNRDIDYILTNPAHYIAVGEKHQISGAIATLTDNYKGKPQSGFGGVIFVRNEEGAISNLTELKGKTISAVNIDSLGGYQAQAYELKKAGVDIENDVQFIYGGMPHCNSVNMVLNGESDAGFARTGVIETMIEQGLLDWNDLIILNQQSVEGFNQYLSTEIYPEWPFVALPHIKPQEAQRVAASLFMIDEFPKFTRSIGISGFTIPERYLHVEMLMMNLHIPPYDKSQPITLAQVWRRYYLEILILYGVALTLIIYALNRALTSKILEGKNKRLEELTNQLKTMNESLTEISNRDSLTGLYNRRYFESFIEEKLKSPTGDIKSMALCVIDIDFFKFYNDRYGHSMGDRVIVEVANTLLSQIDNDVDLVARYAGDEFIIIIHNVDMSGLHRISQDIVKSVSDISIDIPEEYIMAKVSISMGVTYTDIPSDHTSEELFQSADKALYKAKNQGKNCYAIYE